MPAETKHLPDAPNAARRAVRSARHGARRDVLRLATLAPASAMLAALAAPVAFCLPRAARAAAGDGAFRPTHPLRLIVPFPPGGGTDLIGRLLAERLGPALHVPVVVDNRPGAGGNIGLDAVAKAAPDGGTLGVGQTANLAINPYLYERLPFDPQKDFAAVAAIATQPMVLVVARDSPFRNVTQVVDAARGRPQPVRVGLAGNGTVGHLTGELFARRAGIELPTVPYRGAAQALTDLLGGQFELYFGNAASVQTLLAQNRLRALAVTSRQRMSTLPDVPTLAESGYPDFEASTWTGIVAPARTPAATVASLNAELNTILAEPAVQQRLAGEGSTALGGSAGQFAELIAAENRRWSALIRDAGIRLE